jgi:hypothetical protein
MHRGPITRDWTWKMSRVRPPKTGPGGSNEARWLTLGRSRSVCPSHAVAWRHKRFSKKPFFRARAAEASKPPRTPISVHTVIVSTPVDGEAATGWRPCATRWPTTLRPISPLPPMTTIFMTLLRLSLEIFRISRGAHPSSPPSVPRPSSRGGLRLRRPTEAPCRNVRACVGWVWICREACRRLL